MYLGVYTGLINDGGSVWIGPIILLYYSMGKTFKASVDWLGMVENPNQDVNPSVSAEMAQGGQLKKFQKKGEVNEPLFGTQEQIDSYKDSLNLHNYSILQAKKYFNEPNPNKYNRYNKREAIKSMNFDRNTYNSLSNSSTDLYGNRISHLQRRTGYLPIGQRYLGEGSNYIFKKPVQPYILDTREKLEIQKLPIKTSPLPVDDLPTEIIYPTREYTPPPPPPSKLEQMQDWMKNIDLGDWSINTEANDGSAGTSFNPDLYNHYRNQRKAFSKGNPFDFINPAVIGAYPSNQNGRRGRFLGLFDEGGSLPKAQWKDLFKGVGKIFNKADDFNQVTGLSNIKGGRNLLSNFLKSPNNINSNRVININSLTNKFNGVKGKVIDDFKRTPVKLFGENSYGWRSPEYIPTNLIKFDNGFQIQTFKSGKRNNNLVGINGPNDDFDVILYSETGNKHNPRNIAYTRKWEYPPNAFTNYMNEKGFKRPEHVPFNKFEIKADMEGVDSKKINFGIKAIESLLKNPTLSEKNTISLAGLKHWNNQLNFGYNTVEGGSNTTPFLSYGNADTPIFKGLTFNNKGVKPESPDFIPRVNFNDWDEFTGLQFNTKEDLNTATQRLQEYLTKNKLPFTFKTNNNSIQINVPELKRNWQTGGALPKAQSQIPKIINTTKSVLTRPFNIHTYKPSTITSIPEIQIGSKAASNFSSNALTNLNHLSEIEHQNLLDDITLNYAKLYQNDVAIQNQLEKFAQFNPDAQITLSHFRNNDVGGMPLTSDDLYFKDIINRNKNIYLADGDGDPFDYGRMNDLNNNFHSYNSAGGLMIQNIPAIRGGTTDMIIGPNTMQHTDPIHNLFKLSKRSGQWEGANQHTFLINTTNRKPSLIVSGDSGFTSFGNDNGWFNKGLIRKIGENNEDWRGGVDYGSRANFLQKGLNEIGLLDESFKLNTPFKGTYMKFHNVKKYGGEELPKAQVPQLVSGTLKLANPSVRNVNIINKTNPWTVFNSNKVLMNINNRADLIEQYNLRNNMYRTVNIDDKVLNNQNLIEGAKSAGFNPKAKDQLAAFMATTFTDGSGRRAGFTNELKRGSNKGILYTGDYPHILNQRYTTGQPYNSWTIKSNLFEDDVTLLSDQEIYNRISLLDTQQSHEPYKGIFNVGSISSNQQLNNLNVPHGSILNTNTIHIPELMQTNQIYGELFKPVRTPISLFRGDDLNHLLKINPDRFIQFKNGGQLPKAQWKNLFNLGKIFNKADDFNQVTGLSNIKVPNIINNSKIDLSKFGITNTVITDIANNTKNRLLTNKFITNNMKDTGRTQEEVILSIEKFIKEFNEGTFTFQNMGNSAPGEYLGNGKILINTNSLSENKGRNLGTLEHEINHLFSDSKGKYITLGTNNKLHNQPLYDNYPTLKITESDNPFGVIPGGKLYQSVAPEQQVRFRKAISWLEKHGGLKQGEEITEQMVEKLAQGLKNGEIKYATRNVGGKWTASPEEGGVFKYKFKKGDYMGGVKGGEELIQGAYDELHGLFNHIDAQSFNTPSSISLNSTIPIGSKLWKEVVKNILNNAYSIGVVGGLGTASQIGPKKEDGQFKNGGSINNLTSRLIKKYEEGGTLTSAGHKHLKSLGMI